VKSIMSAVALFATTPSFISLSKLPVCFGTERRYQ
jgi:hypothetical protein